MRPASTLVVPACLIVALAAPSRAQDWEFVPSPTTGAGSNVLYGVSGNAWNDVWAAGYWSAGGGGSSKIYTLTLHYDGKAWTQVPSPNPDPDTLSPYNQLEDVQALGPDHALAVGSYIPGGGPSQALAIEWDGSDWTVLSTPVVTGGSTYYALTREPGGDVWIGGSQVDPSGPALSGAMLTQWSGGGSFQVEVAPQVGVFRNRFYAVSALSSQEVWCVGTQGDTYGDFKILIQRYDGGSSWTTFYEPTPGWIDSLNGVAAVASDDVWAVGETYSPTLFLRQPLIMHYDGSSWSQVNLPAFTEGSAELRCVTAVSANHVIASGTYADAAGFPRPFALEYDGSSWSEVTLPASGGSGEWFRGIGTLPGGEVWTVGQYFNGTQTGPVTYRTNAFDLEASAPVVRQGDPLTLTTGPATAGDPGLLFVMQLNGAPSVHLLAVGKFSANGRWSVQGTVPAGLSGVSIGFGSLSLDAGRVFATAVETVSFQ